MTPDTVQARMSADIEIADILMPMISIENSAPATGALNIPAIPAPAPIATNARTYFEGSFIVDATLLPMAAPE